MEAKVCDRDLLTRAFCLLRRITAINGRAGAATVRSNLSGSAAEASTEQLIARYLNMPPGWTVPSLFRAAVQPAQSAAGNVGGEHRIFTE